MANDEKKKASLYEIGSDLKGLYDLMEELVDDEGNPREPTEEEMNQIKEWFDVSYDEFQKKFDTYCKLIKNFKVKSDNVTAEKENFAAEMKRLQKRSKAFENRAKNLQNMLMWCLQNLKLPKFKTDLFSATIQKSKVGFHGLEGAKFDRVPEKYLKPRELDTAALTNAKQYGEIAIGEEIEFPGKTPLDNCKVFEKKGDKWVEIPELRWDKSSFVVIR